MSDPVSNIEIEDVLSSIRRLVSEETGSHPRPEPVRQPPESNRLVLTPALRILDEPEDYVPSVDEIEDIEETGESEDDAPWNNPYATLYTAAKIEQDSPDSHGEPEAISEPQDNIEEQPDTNTELAEHVSDAPVGEPESQSDVAEPDGYVMTNEDQGIDDVDPVLEVELEWSQDGREAQDEADELSESSPDDLYIVAETEHGEEASSEDVGLDDLIPLSAKIAALETAIGETQDQWEPDGAAGDDYAGTTVQTLRWQDHDAEQPDAEETKQESATPVSEITQATEQHFDAEGNHDPELDLGAGDDSIMDEESLRELVAEIVHAELQGALGERITRNVRKLVRREIHRALTTQELD